MQAHYHDWNCWGEFRFCPRLSAQELFLGCSLPFPAQQEWNYLTLPQLLIQPWVEVARSAWITSVYPRPIWPCTTRSCHLYRPSIATRAFLQWERRALKLNHSCFCWIIFKRGIAIFQILNRPLCVSADGRSRPQLVSAHPAQWISNVFLSAPWRILIQWTSDAFKFKLLQSFWRAALPLKSCVDTPELPCKIGLLFSFHHMPEHY